MKTTEIGFVIPELRPDWLVLRPAEVRVVERQSPKFLQEVYTVAKVFDASERVAAYRWLPGRGYLNFDQKFILYKRKN